MLPLLPFALLGGLSLFALIHAFGRPRLDDNLKEDEKGAVLAAAKTEKDPRMLLAFAATLALRDHPLAASLLSRRAVRLHHTGPNVDLSAYPIEYWMGTYRER